MVGQGNWLVFRLLGFDLAQVIGTMARWSKLFDGIDYPWLCWNVDDDWCYVQQQLVVSVGWTPVVGFDPRVGPPRRLLPQSRLIDFNAGFDLPVMYPHFPLEFAFLYTDRLAFWHSDLLVRSGMMEQLAKRFRNLPDGTTAVTSSGSRLQNLLKPNTRRYWELVGCTTRAASRDQFEKGCGWWMNFADHPNCPSSIEASARKRCYWDHGAGIHYWAKKLHGDVAVLPQQRFEEGHCTKIGNPQFVPSWSDSRDAQRNMAIDLQRNFNLCETAKKLGLDKFLE
jgi:hypothetical protein